MGEVFGDVLTARALPPFLGGLLQLSLTLFLVAKSGERRVRTSFAMLAFCASLWSFATAIALGTDEPRRGQWASQLAFAAIAVAGFASLAVGAAMARARTRFMVPAALVAAGSAAALLSFPSLVTVVPRAAGGFWPGPCVGFALAMGASLPPMGLGLLLLRRAFHGLPQSRRRRQLVWSWSAIFIGGLGGLDAHTIFDGGYPIGWVACTLSCLTLFYAIAQYRLMAIRTVVRQTLLHLVGAVVAALLLTALVRLAGRRPSVSLPLIGATVILLYGAVRVWALGVEPALSYVLGWRRRRMEAAFAEFERRALDARSATDVELLLAAAVREALDARLLRLAAVDEAPCSPGPILRDLVDLDGPNGRAQLDALDRAGADALVPLERRGERLAVAVLAGGALSSADDLLAADLGRLAEGAARAWVNARLYEEVARRSATLETQVEERTIALEDALDELEKAQARLAEAERSSALGLLVAGVSHEINNALNFISANLPSLSGYVGACDKLLGQAPSVEPAVAAARAGVGPAMASLAEAVRRTVGIVEDLRKFARPDSERRMVRVEEGLDAALNLLRRRTDGRLDVARLYEGHPTVEGYPGPLNQCFFNLLLDAVEDARGEIWVEARALDHGVEVVIADDRPAAAPPRAPLRLSVSRAIIERHGGTLAVERGERTVLRIELPSRAPEVARAA